MTDEKESVQEEKATPKLIEMVERLEKANEEAKRILEEQKELAAKRLLGGVTDAGEQPKKAPEESPRDYINRMMRGGK